jgi:hypothetical protein
MDAFHEANRRETLSGHIVLTVELVTYDRASDPQFVSTATKEMLDELHLRKIDLADEVLVLNVGGYIGDSTRREVAYAQRIGKPIRWLHPDGDKAIAVRRCRVCGCTDDHACIDCVTCEPCHWVEPDLCSVCAERQGAEDQERERDAQEIRAHEMGSDA